MSEPSSQKQTPQSIEEGVRVMLSNAKEGIRQRHEKYEKRVCKSPTKAMLGAVATGYFLHRMPVRAILVTQVRMISALTPPVLLLFGAAKLYEFMQTQDSAKRK